MYDALSPIPDTEEMLSEWQIQLLLLLSLRERQRYAGPRHRNAPRAQSPSSRVGFQKTREECEEVPIPRGHSQSTGPGAEDTAVPRKCVLYPISPLFPQSRK